MLDKEVTYYGLWETRATSRGNMRERKMSGLLTYIHIQFNEIGMRRIEAPDRVFRREDPGTHLLELDVVSIWGQER